MLQHKKLIKLMDSCTLRNFLATATDHPLKVWAKVDIHFSRNANLGKFSSLVIVQVVNISQKGMVSPRRRLTGRGNNAQLSHDAQLKGAPVSLIKSFAKDDNGVNQKIKPKPT